MKKLIIDTLAKKSDTSPLARKTKKLLNNPTLYFADYLIKRPTLQATVENYSNKVPFAKYHYELYLKYNSLNYKVKAEHALLKTIELDPRSEYYYALGLRLKQKKQWWQAVEALDKAIEHSLNPPKAWYKEYALVLTQMNRHQDAANAWEKAIVNSKNANEWFLYGYALELSNQVALSKEAYAKAIGYDKDKNAKKLGIGIFHEKRGDWIPASKAYEQSVKENPLDANLRYKYGLALDRCYEWERAEEAYLKAIGLDPKNVDWYYRLGFVRERQEKYEEAAKAYMYAAHNRKSHTPYWYYRLGYVLEKAGFYEESNEAFLMMKKIKAPTIKRTSVPFENADKYYHNLGIELKQKKQWWQAVEAFEKAIENASNPSKEWYKEYALVLTQMNRHKDAANAWEKAVLDSKDANEWFLYGNALELSNQVALSKQAYDKAIAYDKDKNAKKLGIGIFHEKRGHWIPASKAYEQSVKENPLDANLRYKYALALDRCYEWERAEEAYLKAIGLEPKNVDWYYRLGFVRERQEKYEEAAKAYMYAANNRKSHTPYWYYRLGYVLEKAGFYAESNEAFLMMKKIDLKQEQEALIKEQDNTSYTYQSYFVEEKFMELSRFLLDDNTSKLDILDEVFSEKENIDEENYREFVSFLLDEKVTKKDVLMKLTQRGINE